MTNTKIYSPLVFARQGDDGQVEVRLITRTAKSEVRVYSQESALNANKEILFEECQVYLVRGGSAHEASQSMMADWRREGFSRIDSTGRAFDLDTRTLSEGLSGVILDTMPVIPVIRSPLWFT